MKFILFVEGYTEKALPEFLKRWLDNKLPVRVGIKCVRYEGWAELRRDVRKKANLYFNGPANEDIIGVISLMDLYGPTFYRESEQTANERYNWAKRDIEREVNHSKFRQFFAVHETEAWLLSHPDLFHRDVRSALPSRIATPESINFDEPPAKLLDRLYKQKLKQTYKKVVHGKALFERLDPQVAYDKCPKLKEILDEMLKMAQEATN